MRRRLGLLSLLAILSIGDSVAGQETAISPEQELRIISLLRAKKYKEGAEAYEKLAPKGKPSPSLQLAYYSLLKGAGRSADASGLISELYSEYSENATILYEMGRNFAARGEIDMGKEFFYMAIKKDPFFAPPYIAIARRSRDRDEVVRFCARALALVEPGGAQAKEIEKILSKNSTEK